MFGGDASEQEQVLLLMKGNARYHILILTNRVQILKVCFINAVNIASFNMFILFLSFVSLVLFTTK